MTAVVPGSFRDPSGFLFTRDGVLYRQVNDVHRANFETQISSGLQDELVAEGLLVPHEEADLSLAAAPGAYKVLRPQVVHPITYPFEWSFSQLKDAARATLEIQKRALAKGMSLRDASAYNMQYHRGRWTLIDSLSFEVLPEGRPWVAYRQFVQHFLAPLALMKYGDVRLGQLFRVHIDGVPADLASSLLPRRTKWKPSLGLHVHGLARAQRKHAGKSTEQESRGRTVNPRALTAIVESLARAVEKQTLKVASHWSGYYDGDSYTPDGFEHKKKLVSAFLDGIDAKVAWDCGANTGFFSRLAADRGLDVLALEFDHASVDVMYRELRAEGRTNVVPLIFDLTNPSPGIGWGGDERQPLGDRSKPDIILALALVHHIAIANNVPLERIAQYFGSLAPRLIIEFVPKSDPKTKVLLSTREDIFPHYTIEGFEAAFSTVYDIERSEKIQGSERTLYLMRRR